MKLYNPIDPVLIRVNIKSQGLTTWHITLCETTQEEVYEFVKGIIEKQNLSPFQTGNRTTIEFREAIGSKNGKSVSLSFKGLKPNEVFLLISKAL